jgi:hypothetical protein
MSIPLEELILGEVNRILSQQQQQALQATMDTVLQAVNANLALSRTILADLVSITSTLDAVLAETVLIFTNMATSAEITALTSDVGAITASWPSAWDTGAGNAVWQTPIPTSGLFAYIHLQAAGTAQIQMGGFQRVILTPQGNDPAWVLIGDPHIDGQGAVDPSTTFPLDYTTILATDVTPAAWLERVFAVPWTTFSNGMVGLADPGANTYFWVVWITQTCWLQVLAALFPAAASGALAPVWPGIADVTLGATQVLADGLLVPGPLQGIIVTISAVPTPISFYPFGPIRSYVHVGAVAFVDDNGQAETVQPLGLDTNVVLPKGMVAADHAYIRLQSGVVGTVQPFTIP